MPEYVFCKDSLVPTVNQALNEIGKGPGTRGAAWCGRGESGGRNHPYITVIHLQVELAMGEGSRGRWGDRLGTQGGTPPLHREVGP